MSQIGIIFSSSPPPHAHPRRTLLGRRAARSGSQRSGSVSDWHAGPAVPGEDPSLCANHDGQVILWTVHTSPTAPGQSKGERAPPRRARDSPMNPFLPLFPGTCFKLRPAPSITLGGKASKVLGPLSQGRASMSLAQDLYPCGGPSVHFGRVPGARPAHPAVGIS